MHGHLISLTHHPSQNSNISLLLLISTVLLEISLMTAGFQVSDKQIMPFPVKHHLVCPALTILHAPPLLISITQQQIVKDAWIPFRCYTMLALKPQPQAYSTVATRTAQHSTISLPIFGKTFIWSRRMCLVQLYQGSILLGSQYRQWLSPSPTISFLHSTAQ